MSPVVYSDLSTLPIDAVRRVDAICDAFEDALQSGRAPGLEELLGGVEELLRPALLRQLLLLECEYREQSAVRVDVREYVARFPEYAGVVHRCVKEHVEQAAREALSVSETESVLEIALPTESGNRGKSGAVDLARLGRGHAEDFKNRGYTVVRELGAGGMGRVYLACQMAANRLVALKVLHGDPEADSEAIERFRREAITLARLQHAHIVPVFEVGEVKGRPFYSMEYCAGGSLADYLHGTPMRPAEAASLVELLARATHAAHRAGIIHRDLKPSNVLLQANPTEGNESNDEGKRARAKQIFGSAPMNSEITLFPSVQALTPKLADFGLAKNSGAKTVTQTGRVLGTPQYMPVEQARGESKGVGPAVDIYALGAILYECLTGRPPFSGQTPLDTLLQVLADDPPPAARLQPNVPRDLDTICSKCLHRDPHRRYATASELADDLARFRNGDVIWARRAGPAERSWRWIKRHPAIVAIIAVFMIADAALAIALWAFGERGEAIMARRKADVESRNAKFELALSVHDEARRQCEKQDDDGRGLLMLARSLKRAVDSGTADLEQVIRKQLAGWGRDMRPLQSVLAGHRGKIFAVGYSSDAQIIVTGSGAPDNTARIWHAATGQQLGPPLEHADTVFGVAVSPDGRMVLTGSADHTAQLWDLTTAQRIGPPLEHEHRVLAVAFSPDGQCVLTGSHDKTARLWETATGGLLCTFEHPDLVRSVAFSPDGKTILTGCDDKMARVWDATSGQPVGQPLQHAERIHAVAFSPDGSRILTGSNDYTAQVWETDTGRPVSPPLRHDSWVMAVAWSPDGRTVLTGSIDYTARLWDAATAQPIGPPIKHRDEVRAVAFAPGGKTVLTGCWDAVARLWSSDTTNPAVLLQHDDKPVAIAFSPDGKTLLTGACDNSARLWDVATGKPRGLPLVHPKWVYAVAFSPDGKTVLTGGVHHTAWLWDTDTGKRLRPLELEDTVFALAFSPDGRRILTWSKDKMGRLWDPATGEPVGPPLHLEVERCEVSFSPDGTGILASNRDNTARLWDVATGQPLSPPLHHEQQVWGVVVSPDAKRVLTQDQESTMRLWDVAIGELLGKPFRHPGGGYVPVMAFSPDGKTILTGSHDKTACLWDTATCQLLGPPLRHAAEIDAVAFSPDGRLVATGSRDNKVRLWAVAPPVEGDPDRIILWAEVLTGMELDKHGVVSVLDGPAWHARKQKMHALGDFSITRSPLTAR